MKVTLLTYTQDAERICAAAARSCYSTKGASELKDTVSDPEKFLSHVVAMGHNSVIEHAVYTFSIEGVSRSLTHQLARHRIASFSQQSQRYVSLKEPTFVVPRAVEENPKTEKIYLGAMRTIWDAYRELEGLGIPAEDARYVLPNGCTTNITVTMNARELWHFFALRCCTRAQWEIRDMATQMLKLVQEISPAIFKGAGPSCANGPCPEGSKSCGRPWKQQNE